MEVEATAITAWFQTAWAPPVPVIEALCEQFPRVSVEMHYYEGGMFFGGTLTGANGAVEDQPADDVKSFAESAFDAVFEDDE